MLLQASDSYNTKFVDLIQDIYARREEEYLKNIKPCTIVVEPVFGINVNTISLSLTEGYFCGTAPPKHHYLSTRVKTILQESPVYSIDNANMNKLLLSFFDTYVAPFDHGNKIIRLNPLHYLNLTRQSSWGILFSSIVIVSLMFIQEKVYKRGNPIRAYALFYILSILTGAMAVLTLSLFNTVVSFIVAVQLTSTFARTDSAIYILQFINSLPVFIVYLLKSRKAFFHWKSEKKVAAKCTTFVPSPVDSSIYSNESDLLKKSSEINSLKSFKDPETHDPMLLNPQLSRKRLDQELAKIRPSPKMGINIQNDVSFIEPRSFSAPLIQYGGSGSTTKMAKSCTLRIESWILTPCKLEEDTVIKGLEE